MRVYCFATGRERLFMMWGSRCILDEGKTWKVRGSNVGLPEGVVSHTGGADEVMRMIQQGVSGRGYTSTSTAAAHVFVQSCSILNAWVCMVKSLRVQGVSPLPVPDLVCLLPCHDFYSRNCIMQCSLYLYAMSPVWSGELVTGLTCHQRPSSAYCNLPCRQCPSRS